MRARKQRNSRLAAMLFSLTRVLTLVGWIITLHLADYQFRQWELVGWQTLCFPGWAFF